ncbi:MAG: TfoX/Sxy family protein [Candidatus Promineifilaceae bacterium]
MAYDQNFIEFIVDQIEDAGEVTYKKMFGAYGIFVDKKFIAIVDDSQLFLKPTENGRLFIGAVVEAPPYPGAKMYFLIEERLEDSDWLSELFRVTAQELPKPKPKKNG